MFEKIFDEIKNNLKNPKLYVCVLSILIVVLLLFPYIDANVFYYNRVNNRVDVLIKVSEIDVEKLQDNDALMKEYNGILSEIEKQSDGSLGSVFIKETNNTVNIIKFIIGGIFFWILAIACFFIKGFKRFRYRILGFLTMVGFGYLFGLISKSIPTIITPIINYVAFPIILLSIIALLSINNKKIKQEATHNE